jgi:hypothetical protein
MVKKKRYKPSGVDEKEMLEIRAHNKIIDEKEKSLKLKHQEAWKKKKDQWKKEKELENGNS